MSFRPQGEIKDFSVLKALSKWQSIIDMTTETHFYILSADIIRIKQHFKTNILVAQRKIQDGERLKGILNSDNCRIIYCHTGIIHNPKMGIMQAGLRRDYSD